MVKKQVEYLATFSSPVYTRGVKGERASLCKYPAVCDEDGEEKGRDGEWREIYQRQINTSTCLPISLLRQWKMVEVLIILTVKCHD